MKPKSRALAVALGLVWILAGAGLLAAADHNAWLLCDIEKERVVAAFSG